MNYPIVKISNFNPDSPFTHDKKYSTNQLLYIIVVNRTLIKHIPLIRPIIRYLMDGGIPWTMMLLLVDHHP